MMKACLLYFPDCKEPANRLAHFLQIESDQIQIHHFPDGESLITLPERLPECVIIYESLNNPNQKLIELLFAARGARNSKVKNLILIAPYLAYMRQDKCFRPGQVVSQKVIGTFLSELFDSLITIDAHLHRINNLSQILPGCRAINLTTSALTANFIVEHFPYAPFLLGPDEESLQWVAGIAKNAGLEYGVCKKIRYGDKNVNVTLPNVNLRNRHVILIDDIASTGYTLAAAAQELRKSGINHIDCIITHALFAKGALKLLKESGIKHIITSDTISHSTNKIFIAPIVAKALEDLV